MIASDRTLAATTARLCAAVAPVAVASIGITLLALASLALIEQPDSDAWSWWIAALLGAPALWYALRLRFDAAVFDDLAQRDDVDDAAREFDGALAMLSRRGAPQSRPVAERARGARRLVDRLCILVALQLVAALVATWPG